jgi:hypothetical protein
LNSSKIKKYNTASPVVIFAFIVVTVLGLLGVLNPPSNATSFAAPLIYMMVIYAILIDVKFGIYVTLSDKKLCQTYHFVYSRCVEISKIDRIEYKPTWISSERHRSVYVFERSTGKMVTKMSNTAYNPQKLAEIIGELKHLNPAIVLGDEMQEFLKRYRLTT